MSVPTQNAFNNNADSLYVKSQNKSLDFKERLNLIDKAIYINKVDSLLLKYISYKSSIYSNYKKYEDALTTAKTLLIEAKNVNDTFYMGKASYKLGLYQKKLGDYQQAYKEFSIASNYYLAIADSLNYANSLSQLASLTYYTGNFYEAEKIAITALKSIPINETKVRFRLYGLLALSSKELKDFDNVSYWCENALKNATTPLDSSMTFNTLGLNEFYRSNYSNALKYYEKALSYKITDNSNHLLMVYSNKELSKGFLGDQNAIIKIQNIAKQRQQSNDVLGAYASYIHLTKLNLKENKNKQALSAASEAYKIALEIKSLEAQKESLGFLIELENYNSNNYSKKYKNVTDSIISTKTRIKTSFDKTKFQTEIKEKENLKLKAEKAEQAQLLAIESKRKWQLGGLLAAAITGLGVFGFYYRRNKKQKDLIESLQKELHHRVKNNLSIIDTFIEVAKEEFEDPRFSNKLSELQNRIDSINAVHQQLYIKEDITNLNLKNYIDQLATNVAGSFTDHHITVENKLQAHITIPADQSFSIGLIVNEFLTNSFKYAFDDKKGKVYIAMNEEKNGYLLTLSDNGKGLPENFDIEKTDSFGLRIIKLLTQQLNATFDLKSDRGVQLHIEIPK